jgi:uncharacterized membrane protein YdcZ (DUF606 family)
MNLLKSARKIWTLKREYLVHILLPIMYVFLCYLMTQTIGWTEPIAIIIMTLLLVALVFVNYVVYQFPPKRYRLGIHIEYVPIIGCGIVIDDMFGIVVPGMLISLDMRDVYKFIKRTQ